MKVSELKKGAFSGTVEGTLTEVEEPREVYTRYGKRLTVSNAVLEDDSGTIKLTLWNEDAGAYKQGERVRITNGFVSEFKGVLSVSAGRNGKIEKIEEE